MDGPISTAWNCNGIPHFFLLDDRQIIQDVPLIHATEADFELAIDALLVNVPASRADTP